MTLPEPYYQDKHCTIYHGDCLDILPHLEPVDLVLTDPPYGIGGKWAKGSGFVGKGLNGSSRLWGRGETWDDAPISDDLVWLVISAGKDVIFWGGHYYVMPPTRCLLVWDKKQDTSPGATAEIAWTNLDTPSRVFRMSRIDAYQNKARFKKAHPTEKPIDLMRWCIAPLVAATVLDPFMGSGTTLVAAKELGRKAIGIEISKEYCDIAVKRLRQETLF